MLRLPYFASRVVGAAVRLPCRAAVGALVAAAVVLGAAACDAGATAQDTAIGNGSSFVTGNYGTTVFRSGARPKAPDGARPKAPAPRRPPQGSSPMAPDGAVASPRRDAMAPPTPLSLGVRWRHRLPSRYFVELGDGDAVVVALDDVVGVGDVEAEVVGVADDEGVADALAEGVAAGGE